VTEIGRESRHVEQVQIGKAFRSRLYQIKACVSRVNPGSIVVFTVQDGVNG
jgi:hypothetical protein